MTVTTAPKVTPFRKILIANRAEIAVRIARSARKLGYRTVAVYSDIDASSLHVKACDESVHLGGTPAAESYLNIGRLIAAARISGADAIHPGYGFLAENAAFAEACKATGLVFIGPSAAAIAAMGDKARAKILMRQADVPCIPGYDGEDQDDRHLRDSALAMGYPLMIKAAAGGGGRGIRRVDSPELFDHALHSARSEASNAFGDGRVILEKIVEFPRHVEVQVLGDRHGNIIHLGERDCSVQRRFQKLIEEAPSPIVDSSLREAMGKAATRAASAIAYEGAGTVEFLLDRDRRFYFMEMNTRLQVEHTVTEEITGLDLVELQLRVAAGEPLPIKQQDVRFSGHSIQVRLCSEDPQRRFLPQGGRMHLWRPPADIRVEHALESGALVPPDYDSMIAKLIVKGHDREQACRVLESSLMNLVALGVATNQNFLAQCIRHPVFASGAATTAFIDGALDDLLGENPLHAAQARLIGAALIFIAGDRRKNASRIPLRPIQRHPSPWLLSLDEHRFSAEICLLTPDLLTISTLEREDSNQKETVEILQTEHSLARLRVGLRRVEIPYLSVDGELLFALDGRQHRVRDLSLAAATRGEVAHDSRVRALMGGRVVAVHAATGDRLSKSQPILTIEAMKIEHTHVAPAAGKLDVLHVNVNQQVALRQILAELSFGTESPP